MIMIEDCWEPENFPKKNKKIKWGHGKIPDSIPCDSPIEKGMIKITTRRNNKFHRKNCYLSFIRIRTFPASSLAFFSTTILAYSFKFCIILLNVSSSNSKPATAVENPDMAVSVSRLRSSLIEGQVSFPPNSSRDSTGSVRACVSFFCKTQRSQYGVTG